MKSRGMYQSILNLSKPMADFSFGFTEGSFLLLNGQKHLRSVAEDLISNKQNRTEQIYQKLRRHGENKCHVMKTSSV